MPILTIEMLNIVKTFPGVTANDNITFKAEEGEIHALLGENGAGKSTLMSILFGLYRCDSGSIKIRGKEVKINSPKDAAAHKIGMVHQHFKLVRNFTAAQNIVLGIEQTGSLGCLDMPSAEKRIAELSDIYALKINPHAKIENMSVGMQQRVEILKILYRGADIFIFDEPTAVLTPQETDELLSIFQRLKAEGKTIIFITHKLKEIKAAADRCTILRHGKKIDTVEVGETTEVELAEKMIGRSVSLYPGREKTVPGKTVLKIDKLAVIGSRGVPAVRDFSLEVRAGEITGIAGVDGNGQQELIAAISGFLPVKSGAIYLNGKKINSDSIRSRIESGIGLVPEDRHRHGLVPDFRMDENFILKNYNKAPYSGFMGMLNPQAIYNHAEKLIAEFDIRSGKGPLTLVKSMSGGNQQKVVIAREIDMSPHLLIVSQPSRGLDVGAVEYIHRRIITERNKGRAVLLVSNELDEILGLSDRIAVISAGSVSGIINSEDANERLLGEMMGGMKPQNVTTEMAHNVLPKAGAAYA